MALTEVQEWLELEKRMKIFIEENTDEVWMRPLGVTQSPLLADNYGVMKSALHDILDLDSARHRFSSDKMTPTNCEIGNPQSKSATEATSKIFDTIEKNILFLYDPCVQKRIWNAYHLQDNQFFKQLSKAVSNSVKGRQKTNNYVYILRNFLALLHDHDIVDLEGGNEEYWTKAFSIVENLRLKKPALRRIKSSSKHLRGPKPFRDNCKKWFKSN